MRKLPVIQASPLPPLYAGWMAELIDGPIPRETDATCDDCAMCDDGQHATNQGVFFNPETKCCTYVPTLPNFLVGRILADDDPDFAKGRATLEERMYRGVQVSPLGIGQPPDFQALYGLSAGSLFGQSTTLRCPHYLADEGGRCGLWKHRASICATWHCKFVRGAVGARFWSVMHQLLSAIELSLSRWCVFELEVGSEALRYVVPFVSNQREKIDPRALDGRIEPTEQRKRWGNWAGLESDFYRECARRVEALHWRDIVAIGGPEIKILAQQLREAYEKLVSKKVPEALRLGRVQIVNMNSDRSQIVAHSPLDPLEIPLPLLQALAHFDGRPTKEVLKSITAQHQLTLDGSLIRKLTDFEVLVPDSPG